jgi:hypothetical protein
MLLTTEVNKQTISSETIIQWRNEPSMALRRNPRVGKDLALVKEVLL